VAHDSIVQIRLMPEHANHEFFCWRVKINEILSNIVTFLRLKKIA